MKRNLLNPLSWFRRPTPRPRARVLLDQRRGEYVDVKMRRFDAATTDRLNASHWQFAHGESINHDLFTDLDRLQARCSWEAANNSLVHGAIETLTTDVFGAEGPTLRVQGLNKRANDRIEGLWRDVWEMPDPNGVLSGVMCGHTWIRQLCTLGSFVNVFANVERQGPVKFGFTTVSARRMGNPPGMGADPNMAFGVRMTEAGRPIKYYIAKRSRFGLGQYDPTQFEEFDASQVQHRFVAHEPEQITGFPWLTSCLGTVADLRDLDHYVMQAAKLAACNSMGLEASSPEFAIDPEPITTSTVEWEAASVNVAPKGWKWVSNQSTQPSAEYAPFRHERLRELGLALGMPLMMVLLSSADSNFASAHYDGAVYMRRIRAIQSWLALQTLGPMLQQVILEAVLAGYVSASAEYRIGWAWPVPPYVNPEKQAKADRMAMEDGIASPQQVILGRGGDPDAVLAEREAWNQELASRDLAPGPDERVAAPLVAAESKAEQDEQQEASSARY